MNPWECPRCHTIWAGWISKCTCAPNKDKDGLAKEISKKHPELSEYLKKTIKMDPVKHTMGYFPEKPVPKDFKGDNNE